MLAIGALLLTLVPLGALAEPSSDEVERDLDRAQQRLDEIDEELAQHLEAYNQAQVDLEEAQARLDATREELAGLQQRSEELLEVVVDHVRTLHKIGPTLELSTVMMTADPTEAGTRATTLRRILDSRQADLESLTAATDTIDALESRLADERERAQAATEAAEEQRAAIEAAHARVEDEIAELHEVLEETIEREEEQARREQERRERERAERQEQQAQADQQASTNDGAGGGSTEGGGSTDPAPAARASAQTAIDTALAQLGKPYAWGGSGPGSFDCSGLTSYAWAAAGVQLPRTSGAQYAGTTRISRSELQPGDLVFYHSPISHVAMYIGGTRVVEAPNSGNHVRIREDGLTRSGIVGYGRP